MPALSIPDHNARVFTLPNGLEIIVQEDHSSPVASVQAWVKTGSIHEGKWVGAGLSHFLEHMLFKGTPSRGPQEFARSVQDHGGYINAYTSFDRTVYWIDIPSRGAEAAIDLLSDALMNSNLPADEAVKEQEVIRREFAMGFDDPDSVAGKQMFATAFAEHPLKYPVIGHLDIFNQLTRDDLFEYYKSRYVPNNIFFVVVGDVDADAVHAQLAAFFEKHPRRALPDVFIPREPGQLGRRDCHTEFETELTRLGFGWHVPEVTHADMPALDLLATVLGGGRSSRLYRRLREDLAIVHSVDSWCYTPSSGGLFGIDAMLDPEKRGDVEREVMAILQDVAENGVLQDELEKARRQFLSHQISAFTSMRGKASNLGSDWLFARSVHFTRDYLAAAQHITPDDIRRVARTYFVDSNLTVSSVNPKGHAALVEKAPGAGDEIAIQSFTLSNGLRLLVREDSRLPLVSMVASFKAGLLAETSENNGINRLLARTLLKGTKTRTAEEIADTIESVGGGLGADSGNNSINITAKVLSPDLSLGLELMADVLQNSTFPEKAVEREKEVQLASIKADEEEMTSVARNILRARLFGDHPLSLRTLGTPASVKALTPAALASYRECFLCAKNGVLAVFGDVKSAEVVTLVERYFSTLHAGGPALESLAIPAFPTSSVDAVERKQKAQAVLMLGFPGADMFNPDRGALELIDEACSDLGSRLFNRIREEMGLAYFVGSSNLLGLVPGAFIFYLGTDPAKIDEVRAALSQEVAKLVEGGLNDDEIARAKEKLLGGQAIRNQSNDALAFGCALDELYGLGHAHYQTLRARIEAVTAEDIRRVAAKYFTQPAVTAIAMP
jgi:zinc protease